MSDMLKCMVIGWVIGTGVAILILLALYRYQGCNSELVGLIVGGIFANVGIWFGGIYGLKRI